MRTRRTLTAGIIFFLACATTSAAEPWADRRLPKDAQDGLLLWLDAGAQNAACKELGRPELKPKDAVETWYDSSGWGKHLTQPRAAARPTFRPTGGSLAAVRFDGADDFLAGTGIAKESRETTVFIVAAPFGNKGGFRALLAANKKDANDFVTGVTVDFGPGASGRWQSLNVEGSGFGGAVSLWKDPVAFAAPHRLCVTCREGDDGVRLFVDGVATGTRKRTASMLAWDQVTLGARFYALGVPPSTQGFFDGDLMEVLVYDRALNDDARKAVENYLAQKYAQYAVPDPPERVKEPTPRDVPPVQVFVPGFSVRELPVDLPNVNNVLYRADGKLVALAYDGNVYLLSDTDGDGLENRAELFWNNKGSITSPIGMALTPKGYQHGSGVFVACKGKLALLVDTDGDDRADKEIVVADGWKPLDHGVDALGVTLDRDGNVYFGLGTANYTDAYLLKKQPNPGYDLKDERGTILKVSPDFRKREIVATGIRFPVGLRFNARGDLFATDQEGATWLPNGNPFDELLHIQPGRHYGFPPRHPKHLPDVIDEPSVFDYSPQHQSTCGLCFNESVHGGPVFGPEAWKSDAFVTGYSRGKLYRTQLVPTASGYVARNHLFASLNMLPVDACVSPRGELVVAVHSGLPDWGSGPKGKGKLYKISYAPTPQPILVWPAGPREIRVAFDRPVPVEQLQNLAARVKAEGGAFVGAGDRFEVNRPGYAVVQMQRDAPRETLPVQGVSVSADRRTLILTTAAHLQAVNYALTLPGLGRPLAPDARAKELPQQPAIDLGYDLTGAAAEWRAASGQGTWQGWLPHLDLAVARPLTAGSAEHEAFWAMLSEAGTLTLRTRLDLWHMLRPAVQPGSSIDYTWPAEDVTLTFTANGPLTAKLGDRTVEATKDKKDQWVAKLTARPKQGELLPAEVTLTASRKSPELSLAWHTQEDSRPRALALGRMLLPWAPARGEPVSLVARRPAELEGGDRERGRVLFYSERATCSRCHQVRGEGGRIGPDLSNLVHRDYASVLRDIQVPSAALNPDHLTYVVTLTNGRVLTGTLRSEGTTLIVGDVDGKETRVPRAKVEEVAPLPMSLMPEGLDRTLKPEEMRDLMTFLLVDPLKPAPIEAKDPPPARTQKEVDALLKDSAKPEGKPKKLSVVLCAGKKDHGPGEHDYPLWQRRWTQLLESAENVLVSQAMDWPTAKQLESADLIVFFSSNPAWNVDRAKELEAYLERGGGAVFIHYAVNGRKDVDALSKLIGLAWKDGGSKFRHGETELTFPDPKHPICRNFGKLKLTDESYWNLSGDVKNVTILATAVEDGQPRPVVWSREQGKGRVFVTLQGHYNWTFDDPLYRVLLLRGMAWSAREPVDRFNPLVTVGARMGGEP